MGRHGAPRRARERDHCCLSRDEWWAKYGAGGRYSSHLQPAYLWRCDRLRIRFGWAWWSCLGDGTPWWHGWALTAAAAEACAFDAAGSPGGHPRDRW